MRPNLAALVTACFAVAVSTPPVGVVVHHHAGGELPHLHADLDDDAPHHAHHDAASDVEDDHDHPHDEVSEGPGVHVARAALEWHTHATSPFHRATPAQRTEVSRPQPVALLNIAAPTARATRRAIALRSRGPPLSPCSQESQISF